MEELRTRILAVEEYEESDVIGLAEAAWALSEADAQTDADQFTPDYVWYYRDYYAGLIPLYGDYTRAKMGAVTTANGEPSSNPL